MDSAKIFVGSLSIEAVRFQVSGFSAAGGRECPGKSQKKHSLLALLRIVGAVFNRDLFGLT